MDLSSKSTRDQKILDRLYKQSADKIIQMLDKINEHRALNERRWIWELMQNAKDTKNKFGEVRIKIELHSTHLTFSHNADPFTEDNLISLAQQVSSKDSENTDSDITGKFGTGFISTHLLSRMIQVNGYLIADSGSQFRFHLTLDRRPDKSEEMIPLIENVIDQIRNLENNQSFEQISSFESSRNENDFTTSFTYSLEDDFSKSAAKNGIADLVTTLPVTLLFLSNIKNVEVVNNIENQTIEYSCESIKKNQHISHYKISSISNTLERNEQYFIKWSSNNIQLVAEINDHSHPSLIQERGQIPLLYRDFPLVGSEKFHFPFFLNGLTFYPTEERNGILLNNGTPKGKHNRSLLTEAQTASLNFSDWLLSSNIGNLFYLANTRIPQIANIEPETKEWFINYQAAWREQLLERQIVTTVSGLKKLREALFPKSSISDSYSIQQQFYTICLPILGPEKLPINLQHQFWIDAIGPKSEYDSWGLDLIFDEKALINFIQESKNLNQIALTALDESLSITKWLNQVLKYLIDLNQIQLILESRIIPNHKGEFKILEDLWWESLDEKIPDPVLDVLELIGYDWRSELVHPKIGSKVLVSKVRKLSDASSIINKYLNQPDPKIVGKGDFLEHPKALNILIGILKLRSPNSRPDSFASKIYQFSKDIFHFEDSVDQRFDISALSLATASRWMTRLVNRTIQAAKDINGLSKKLNKSVDQTIVWLDQYLRFLQNSGENSILIKEHNIIPNRNLEFSGYDDTKNYGTEDYPLDESLLKILKELDSKQDYFPQLIADGIGIKLEETMKFEDIGFSIMGVIDNIARENTYHLYRNQLLALISWSQEKKNKPLAERFLPRFVELKNRIFFVLTVEQSLNSEHIMVIMKTPPERIEQLANLASSGANIDKLESIAKAIPNQEKLEQLAQVINAGVDIITLGKIAEKSTDPKVLKKVLDYATEIEEEEQEFQFKLHIGQSVETYFRQILEQEQLDAQIKYIGAGSHDFEIISLPNPQKKFFIELKSHANGNFTTPIKLAVSQAKQAVETPEIFALCILERPLQNCENLIEYVKENLKYVGGLSSDFAEVIQKEKELARIKNDMSSISLEIKDPTCMVKVNHEYIKIRHKNFLELTNKIRQSLA